MTLLFGYGPCLNYTLIRLHERLIDIDLKSINTSDQCLYLQTADHYQEPSEILRQIQLQVT